MKKRVGGRVAAMKAEVEQLTFAMQKFCLDPREDIFRKICACDALIRAESSNFTIWREACLYKYGADWSDTEGGDFLSAEKILCDKSILSPSKTIILQIMYMFYATGELKYIDLFYQCLGHERLSIQTKQYLARLYSETKKMYKDEILSLLSVNPAHFHGIDVKMNVVNFTYFDDIGSITESLKDMENIMAPRADRPKK